MSNAELAQHGLLTDPTTHVEFLTFVLNGPPHKDDVTNAMHNFVNVTHSIRQKDTAADMTLTVGFSKNGWEKMFPELETPAELEEFRERTDGPRHMPATPGDIFVMIKSTRMDLNLQAGRHLIKFWSSIAKPTDDVQGFKYLDDRDLIDFVDGTENPTGEARADAVLNMADPYPGSSYLTVQKYTHRTAKWEAAGETEQEHTIGRTKFDDIEFSHDKKKPYAHNVKSKVHVDGKEIKMFRQNRPFGNAMTQGTIFVGFAKSPATLSTSLDQMITADADGVYDHLLDFMDVTSGANYFIPPKAFIDQYA